LGGRSLDLMAGLRARLFLGVAALVVATGLAAGGLDFRWAFQEAIELQDSILEQVGGLAARNHLQAELPAEGGVDAEARIVIQELGGAPDGRRPKLGLDGLPNDLEDGLQTLPLPGGKWRVLVRTRADGSRVAIAQPTAARDEIARDSAVRTILPLGVLVPCLMLLVGVVIHTSFRPVLHLASRLDVKQSGHLEKLPTDGIPTELHPFIASINRLLQRTAVLFEHQRRFIADAAHELRTPITALTIQAENLGHEDLTEESRTRLAALRSGIRRTAHLAEQLLDLARYDENNHADVEVVKLDAILKKSVSEYLPFAQARSIDIGFDRIEHAPVRGNPTGLAALARNLIDNAIRYSPDGGQIDIAVSSDRDCVVLRIDDGGPGVPEAQLDRIFEPFNRGNRPEGDGTGLGLSIVRRVVDNYRGSIRLENLTPSGRTGLRAIVTFPRA
jgi:two-component system, OmpR family, sensor kinase